jgi:hypothetical protein
MEPPLAPAGNLDSELIVESSQEVRSLKSISVSTNGQLKDFPPADSVHEIEAKEPENTGESLQNEGFNGDVDTRNKEAPRSDFHLRNDRVGQDKKTGILFFNADLDELPKRRGRAKIRLEQSKIFLDLIEDRVSYLEERMHKVLGEAQFPMNDIKANDEESKRLPPSQCNVATLDWTKFVARVEVDPKSFATWKHRAELDHEPKSIIEILVEEPRLSLFQRNLQTQVQPLSLPSEPTQHSVVTTENAKSQPYQIRIRSKLLLKTMKEITGCQTARGPYEHRLLLLPPFKLLVRFEQELRNKRDELRKLYAIEQRPIYDRPLKDTEGKEALDYLAKLCSVLDQYFTRQIKLYKELSPEVSKAQFNDLWYIFKPGCEVRTPGDARIQM